MARNKVRNRLQKEMKRTPRGPDIDKVQVMKAGVATVNDLFDDVFKSASSGMNLTDTLRAIMKPRHLALYDLALRCETEMLKCEEVGAYLAGCLMGAAMIEAFLSLMCLFYQAEVIETSHYKGAIQRESYDAMVGNWKFEHLIRVVAELSWIPDDVVAEKVIVALIEVYRELMPMSEPGMSQAQIDAGAAEFDNNPGVAMLRLIQSLRNSIHSGQWIRGDRVPDATHFDGWCHIALRLSGEIRNCLIHRMTTTNMSMLENAMTQFNEQIDTLKALFVEQGKDPKEVDALIETMMKEALDKAALH